MTLVTAWMPWRHNVDLLVPVRAVGTSTHLNWIQCGFKNFVKVQEVKIPICKIIHDITSGKWQLTFWAIQIFREIIFCLVFYSIPYLNFQSLPPLFTIMAYLLCKFLKWHHIEAVFHDTNSLTLWLPHPVHPSQTKHATAIHYCCMASRVLRLPVIFWAKFRKYIFFRKWLHRKTIGTIRKCSIVFQSCQ
jgi:hypothetical protein